MATDNVVQPKECRVIGDDWQFTLNATLSGVTANLTGYTPGGTLIEPLGATLPLAGMFDTSNLATGSFVLTIPSATTSNLTPDECAYKIQVTLTDPYGIKTTRAIIPLRVDAV